MRTSDDAALSARFPDPRPVTSTDAHGVVRLDGWRCRRCDHPLALAAPRCPLCRGELRTESFGPRGVVWSSTVVRVPLPGREPPYALAYVDLDDGPRVIGHLASGRRAALGTPVVLRETSPLGDLLFEGSDG